MGETINKKAHWSYWLVGILALLWNIGGSINYLMQQNAEFVATLPQTHIAIIKDRPAWATAGFALGVFGGAIGALLLLLRKKSALILFAISLIGIALTMIHTTRIVNQSGIFSFGEVFVMLVLPLIVGAFLLWYARLVRYRQWVSL